MGDHVKAIPKMLNLSSRKPTTVEAYSRQVSSIATNAQSFGPNTYANIVIDTSTPGAFLDPTQTFLEFDFEVQNNNAYVDYMNLGAAGMASFIEEFRIYNQGTPIEEILSYNVVFEHFMKIGGHAQTEFKLFMENSWRPPVPPHDANELNFVKPPMVDRDGLIMYPNVVNMFGDRNTFCSHREQGPYFHLTHNTIASSSGTVGASSETGSNNIVTYLTGNSTGTRYPPYYNYLQDYFVQDCITSLSSAPGTIQSQTFDHFLDNTYVTWPSTIRPEPLILNQVRAQQEENVKNFRLQDYFMYLVNVKNIPIGVAPAKSYISNENGIIPQRCDAQNTSTYYNNSGSVQNFTFGKAGTLNSYTPGKFKIHVVLPMFSGLLGCWAEKAFPAMLISPGSFYIQIKWAKMTQAAQFALDPCRRIFGTYRDYVPSYGLSLGYTTEFRGQNLYNENNTIGETILNDDNSTLPNGNNIGYCVITTAGATGCDYAYQSNMNVVAANAVQNNTLATTVAAVAPAAGVPGNAVGGQTFVTAGLSQGTCTGRPKVQYFPRSHPYQTAFFGFDQSIDTRCPPCYERNICYGTYLPFSTAQVRRITLETNGSLTENAGLVTVGNFETATTYLITNLQMTSQQIIVPDEVTASIVRQAAESDISLDAQSVHTYRTVCANSSSQSIILPIKLASANSLYIVFLNQHSQESPYYNSLAGICPFSAFQYTPTASTLPGGATGFTGFVGFFVGSETAPKFQGIQSTDNSISVQLKIGNELFPQYPIRNIPQVIKELQRSVHGTGDMNCNLPYTATVRNDRFTSNVTTTLLGYSEYTALESKQFTCPFVPYQALDDQTITNNILFNDYLTPGQNLPTAPYNAQTVTGAPKTPYPIYNDRGSYMWPSFLPPESTFVIGFDLDTFPGQSDQARSGRFLGNAPLTLAMNGCVGLNNASLSTQSSADPVIALAFALHDIRFSIMAGGQVLSYF